MATVTGIFISPLTSLLLDDFNGVMDVWDEAGDLVTFLNRSGIDARSEKGEVAQ